MQLTLPTDREQLVVWFDTFLDTDDIDIFQVSSSLGDSIVTLAKDIGYIRSDELDKAYWNKLFTAIAKIQKGTVDRAFGCRDVVGGAKYIFTQTGFSTWGIVYANGVEYVNNPSFREAKNLYMDFIRDGWKPLTAEEIKLIQPKDVINDSTIIGTGEEWWKWLKAQLVRK